MRQAVKSDDPEGRLSLGEVAYQKVLTGLFDRTVPAGAFVSQRDLVDLLDVPVQPLRDALRVLEAEGIVTIHPRSGIQFVKPDLDFVHNTYQFRSIMERAAARRFAETGDAELITELHDAHVELIEKIRGGKYDAETLAKIEELERRLHGEMTASLKNPLIETAARRLKNYVTLIRLDRVMTKPYALRTLVEHLEILKACMDRDGEAAEKALADHFQAAVGRMVGTV